MRQIGGRALDGDRALKHADGAARRRQRPFEILFDQDDCDS